MNIHKRKGVYFMPGLWRPTSVLQQPDIANLYNTLSQDLLSFNDKETNVCYEAPGA